MKITNKSINIETEFRHIKVGETFRTDDNKTYMRICNVFSDYYDEYGWLIDTTIVCNAICLATGTTHKFYNSHKVTPVDCECIVTDKKEG